MTNDSEKLSGRRMAYLLLDLPGAGTTIQGFTVCEALLARGSEVDLVVVRNSGILVDRVPAGVRLIELCPVARRWRWPGTLARLLGILRLARYLRSARPDVLISGASGSSLVALPASWLARRPSRVALTITNDFYHRRHARDRGRQISAFVARRFYGYADKVIAVSGRMAASLIEEEGLPEDVVEAIHPPIDVAAIRERAEEPVDHPWFAPDAPPVVISVGRPSVQKCLEVMIDAIALVNEQREVRLFNMGEGPKSTVERLLARAHERGIGDRVEFAPFDENPFKYMARAQVYALSSLWEGSPIVLKEALACGCLIVATDCPFGPWDILAGGKYGALVPMNDPPAMAEAILGQLADPIPAEVLRQRSLDFDLPVTIAQYVALIAGLLDRAPEA
jgi:glycosyltransferase involved in cell wall biosynthesis